MRSLLAREGGARPEKDTCGCKNALMTRRSWSCFEIKYWDVLSGFANLVLVSQPLLSVAMRSLPTYELTTSGGWPRPLPPRISTIQPL